MKKVGEFFACFLPLLGFLAIQVGVAMLGTIVKTVSLAMQGVTSADALEEALLGSDYLMKITIASQLVCFIIFLIFYRVIFKIKKPESPAKVFSATSPLLIIVLFVAVEAITSSILIKVSVLIPDLMQQYAEMIEKSGLADMTVLSTIATLVLAPLGEELAFRGMTLNLAGKFTKKFWIANIIQAAMFGIAHMNIVQGTYAFVLGLVLGFIYKKYNSLYATMIAHLAFNFSGTYLVGLLFGTEDDVPIIRWIVVLAAATVICAFAFVAVLRDKKTFEREPMYMKRIHFREEMPAAYATAGVPVNTTPVNTTDTFNNNGQL